MSAAALQHTFGQCKTVKSCPCSTGAQRFTASSTELRSLHRPLYSSRKGHQRHLAAQALFGSKSLGVGTSEVYVTGSTSESSAPNLFSLSLVKHI